MSSKLSVAEIESSLKKFPMWEFEDNALTRTFEFDDFSGSIDFVNSVAEIAEDADHHPDIDIRWDRVILFLTTHSKNGVTENDFSLAERIDTLED